MKLIDLAPPRPMPTVNAVGRPEDEAPASARLLEAAKRLWHERGWA